ncbi:hypothetical protein SAMN02746065_10881 [Desulfocicer vacuolatum DSM 3385]|uniref:Uncharacterized protein n=1 Tax=Desulfocicer vacuolatum DSM 3385 TaxID=1121400 RepID=A0A1W2BGS4_9BACT|nr:hypothetical protein [Desulfocicer vacuolatum]SMC72056.1 hypothetical protein SAMN02746065_10881 [Desulfocicer vacuolatum DSM 3385]
MIFCGKKNGPAKGQRIANLMVIMGIVIGLLHQPCRAEMNPSDLPGVLQPWVQWVLHGKKKEISCTPRYNDARQLTCSWPGRLNITLGDKGGEFNQIWDILHDTWISLPGHAGQWPFNVKVNDAPALLMMHDNTPAIHLLPGQYHISGQFQWQTPPEYLKVPEKTGLLSVWIKNQPVPFPHLDKTGRLWLKTTQKVKKEEDRLKVERFRKIEDDIPPMITLYTTLEVAGKAREITLGPLYDPGLFIPLSLESDLPSRLSRDGTLRIQVRPGRYDFTLKLRYMGVLSQLTFKGEEPRFQPTYEIWSIVRRPQLRIMEISGVPPVDPRQTSLPKNWYNYPAYRIMPRETMIFKEIKRGDPMPAPDRLTLDRTLWLRFDGSGYTVKDKITGRKNSDWRLEMDLNMVPGKVTVDGMEQLITKKANTDKPGLELRKGILDLTAESTFDKGIYQLPATGWDHDFNQVTGRLNLPPGWQLLHAGGIDKIPGTWLQKWTLLDFFVVLIFTIATAKLFSIPLSLVGFTTLVLISHDPLAPRYVWPVLLVGIALLRHLPPGKFKKTIKFCHGMVVLSLLFTAVPYAVHTLRVGIYPQLEKPWISMNTDQAPYPSARHTQNDGFQESMSAQDSEPYRVGSLKKARKMAAPLLSRERAPALPAPHSMKMPVEPDAMTQTGPGLPRWQAFTTVPFSWSGPVAPGESISFTLIGPGMNRFLAFLRVGLMVVLATGLLGITWNREKKFFQYGTTALFWLIMIHFMGNPIPGHATEIPSSEMLQTLQNRLLEQKDCFPHCADMGRADIRIDSQELFVKLSINAQLDTMVPLPGHARHWLPGKVLLDGFESQAIFRENEILWMMIPKGSHEVILQGKLQKRNTFQLFFSLNPHTALVTARGWTVQGYNPDSTLEESLHFTRISTEKEPRGEMLETGVLPAFARVERHIVLGKEWRVKTTVHRVTPADSAMALHLPLLPGESVITRGVNVKENKVQVNMKADRTLFKWDSFLEPVDTLELFHEQTRNWTEVWTLDVAPRFHVETHGIPVILHQVSRRWMPTWHPWPGEKVTLTISRPTAIKGNTLTLEKSHLVLRPGQRSTQARLSLEMKSTQGGQHTIQLPENARLEEIRIDGKVQLIRQEGRSVPLPVSPGTHTAMLKWREPRGMEIFYPTSHVNLGHASVNAGVDLHLPGNRWPLFMGGEHLTGPAVLFWSVLFVVVIISAGMAFSGATPLGFYSLFLLGLGMSMSSLEACFFVGAWLVAMKRRQQSMATPATETAKQKQFNLIQLGLVALTVVAAGSLLFAVSQGLLGHPDMNITGNGSSAGVLRWYHDVSANTLPVAWVISIPMLYYRLAMLAWALWISFGLIGVVKWAWQAFTIPVLWYDVPRKPFRLKKNKPDKNEKEK